uniref:Uncharacterized protein n=1 Tax=Rhizophora mucronata TaxID=61149 RepID=A0A2P2PGG8_RHIMU
MLIGNYHLPDRLPVEMPHFHLHIACKRLACLCYQ